MIARRTGAASNLFDVPDRVEGWSGDNPNRSDLEAVLGVGDDVTVLVLQYAPNSGFCAWR